MLKQLIILISIVSFGFSNLFISEAAEGTSNNKYLEFYNAGSETIDLSGYAYPSTSNAPDVSGEYEYWNTFTDGATVAPGDVYVVCHGSSDDFILAECDEFHTYLSNGDDGYCLVSGTEDDYTILDCVGDWNADPGQGWEVCGVSNGTKEHTLVRKSSVTTGNAGDWAASAGTTTDDCEWIVLDQNDWSYLGSHTMDSSAMTYIVEAGIFYYAPSILTIEMGDTVVWENVSGTHDVVSYDGTFSLPACSGPCTIGEITFDTPGVYEYFCSVGSHEQQGMVGTIVVNGEIQLDCEDEAACNFSEPGECVYIAEGECDCDGNIEDCLGDCGGDAVVDSCGECGGNNDCTVSVDFLLDMSLNSDFDADDQASLRFITQDGQALPGDWVAMSDDDNDLLFKANFQLASGSTYEYNFSDGWYESGSYLEGCGSGEYSNNRTVVVTETDMVVGPFCWESCEACPEDIQGCTDEDALNYDENATVDDGSCFYEWPEIENLFFSEYAEGTSNNKYLEIYNASDSEIDLSSYSISTCSNGCDTIGEWDYPNNVTFEPNDAILEPGDVYVVCHQSADETILAECNQSFSYLSNGNDVMALTQMGSGLVLDIIGLVASADDTPANGTAGWSVAGVENGTFNHTLVRKSSVTLGNPLWLDNPDTGEQGSAGDDAEDSEWIVLDVDTWDYLGYHESDSDDGGAPDCIQDCPYFDDLDGDNDFTPDEFCTILASWGDDSCIDDCEGEDAVEVNDYITQCEDCLANNDCDDLIDDSECDVDGDVNSDDVINVLDVVQIVSAITSSTTDDLDCADMNGDDLINVLDIVQIVGIITGGRAFDANSASLEVNDFDVILKANGYIGGIQMKLEHGSNFELNLNDNCMVADYMNHGDYSILVIVEPKDEILFTTNSKFEIVDILIANSEEEIQFNMVNDFSLSGAYPNPFNPSTSFNINIPNSGYLSVKVFNISGQLVDVIASGIYSPNSYNFTWNANNMATGMYVINAEFEGTNISHNVSLIK